MENPGKLAVCTNRIKLFLSQVLANANGSCLISYPGNYACVHWIPLPLISYSMVLEMLSHVSTKKTKQFLDQLILMDYYTSRNIVSTVNLGCKLDLKKIALHARNAEYNPKVEV